MKLTLRDVHTSFDGWVGRLKQWLDPPLVVTGRPLEIRQAVMDDIERHAVAAGGGRRMLPENRILVTVLVPTPDERPALQAVLADLQDAVSKRLRETGCQTPGGLAVVVHYTRRPRPGWSPDQRFAVAYSTREADQQPAPAAALPGLRLTVLQGRATQTAYTLTEPLVHIGRTTMPVDAHGRPRKNHVAFVEDGDEHSNSVGRAHASIRFQPARGEYRVFDDGSRNGTRLVRNGRTFEVMRRDPTGVTLASGDEIHLGTASLRVEIRNRG